MEPLHWALLYLAVGALYLAVCWHMRTEKLAAANVREAVGMGLHPVAVAGIYAVGILAIVLPLWPVYFVAGAVGSVRRRKRR